jgi:hypothetical protein
MKNCENCNLKGSVVCDICVNFSRWIKKEKSCKTCRFFAGVNADCNCSQLCNGLSKWEAKEEKHCETCRYHKLEDYTCLQPDKHCKSSSHWEPKEENRPDPTKFKTGTISKEVGLKFDSEKNRLDLIPPEVMEALGKVLTYGAEIYEANSWQNLEDFNDRYYGALLRHLLEYRKGNKKDKESGLPHIFHALCNVAFLVWKEIQEEKDKAIESFRVK